MEFDINRYSQFSDLPFEQFDKMQASISVLGLDWDCLFLNKFACEKLNIKVLDVIGRNIWEVFPSFAASADYRKIKEAIETKAVANLITISPLTGERLSIVGYTLRDCRFFSSVKLDKENLIKELRDPLG